MLWRNDKRIDGTGDTGDLYIFARDRQHTNFWMKKQTTQDRYIYIQAAEIE